MNEGRNAAEAGGAQRQRPPEAPKLRVVVTTDGEIDDRCSMVRFLLYANEWEILGLIHSSSKYHWRGDQSHPAHSWQGTAWLDEHLDRYEQVHASLKRHDPEYPSPEYLREQVFVGNVAYEGEMEEPTPGSTRIVEVLLADDPRAVWLQAWGGANTIARALKTIQEEHPDRMTDVKEKARLFLVSDQDRTLKDYILKEWPGVMVIQSGAFGAIAYRWHEIMTKDQRRYFDPSWMKANILIGRGALCDAYEAHSDGRFRSEGDSPAFMHLIHVGLRSAEHPTYGGWGGRFRWAANRWRSAEDEGDPHRTILRWAAAFQNDWAARADWCVKDFDHANHPPVVRLDHPADLGAGPGDKVALSAEGTHDPDGDAVAFRWWLYQGPSTYPGAMDIENADRSQASFTVPENAGEGQTLHVICEVTDDGSPPLTRYRRVIVEVSDR